MRRDKTAARIILILSVVHVAIAAPAIVRQSSLDVDEDVTSTSEKRGSSFDDTSQDLYPVLQMDNELPTTSGNPQDDDPPPKSGTLQLRTDHWQPQTSGPPPSQDDTSPASEDLQFHNDPAGSEDPQFHNAPSPWLQHSDSVQGESSAQLESGASVHVHDDMSESGKSVHELEPRPTDFPAGEGRPNLKPLRLLPWNPQSPPSWLYENPASPSEADGVFSESMKRKLKLLAGIGAVTAVSAGLTYSTYKLIKDHGYVSAFFPPSPADILLSHKHSDL